MRIGMGDRGTAARNAGISGRHAMTNSTPRTPSIGRDIEILRPGREVMRPKSRAPKMLVMGRFWTPYLKPGRLIELKEVQVTREAYGPVMLLCCWAKGHAEPLYLVRNLSSAEEAIDYYTK